MPEFRMPSINQVALSGRIIQADADEVQIAFTVAVDRPYRDAEGIWQKEITTVPVRVSGKLAEYATERLSQGKAVFLTGRLNSRGAGLEVIARHIQFLDQESKPEEA